MTELLPAPPLGEPEIDLLILLFTGHVLADFLFQTRSMVERKGEIRALSAHAGVVVVTHWILVLPFVRWPWVELLPTLGLLLLLGALHTVIDLGKVRLRERLGADSVGLFVADQLCHVAAVLAVWALWWSRISSGTGLEPWLAPEALAPFTTGALLLGVYVLNGNGAAALIKLFLDRFPVLERVAVETPEAEIQRMGWTIGILERMLVLSLVLLGQWQAIGWIFAGKTVARFRELNDRAFSEYYLIGTLSSLLFATGTGLSVRLLLTGGI